MVGYGKMGRLIERFAPEYGFEVEMILAAGFNNRPPSASPENLLLESMWRLSFQPPKRLSIT